MNIKKTILLSSGLYLLASFSANAQVSLQATFFDPGPRYVEEHREYPQRVGRHRNYDWNYWHRKNNGHAYGHDNDHGHDEGRDHEDRDQHGRR